MTLVSAETSVTNHNKENTLSLFDRLPPPTRGSQIDLHVKLYSDEIELLDRVTRYHNCSRSTVLSALIREYLPTIMLDKRKGGGVLPPDIGGNTNK